MAFKQSEIDAMDCLRMSGQFDPELLSYLKQNGKVRTGTNELVVWGDNAANIVGAGPIVDDSTRKAYVALGSVGLATICAGEYSSGTYIVNAAIANDGTMYTWGSNTFSPLGRAVTGSNQGTALPVTQGVGPWKTVATGMACMIAINTQGHLYAAGYAANGRLGNNSTSSSMTTLTRIGTATNWSMVDGSQDSFNAIQADGTLWGWGNNSGGRNGLGTTTGNTLSPTKVGTDTDWLEISAAPTTVLALKTNGTMWGWGSSTTMGKGSGTTAPTPASYSAPVQIGTDTDWVGISAGPTTSIARKANGTIWMTGSGSQNRLNTVASTNNYGWTQIGTDTDWIKVKACADGSWALKANGDLYYWGACNKGYPFAGASVLMTKFGNFPGNVLVSCTKASNVMNMFAYGE